MKNASAAKLVDVTKGEKTQQGIVKQKQQHWPHVIKH